jgi:hypothetical protein
MDTQKSDEAQNDSFETIEPEKDNLVGREFEIGQLGQQELTEDELTRDAKVMDHWAMLNLRSESFNEKDSLTLSI